MNQSYSVSQALADLRKKNEAAAAAEPVADDPRMQQMQNDIWRLNMLQLPQNTGGAQLDLYGNGQIDPKTGQMGQVDQATHLARLQQVYAQRPDLLWPGTNPNGTIQMNFTGDRYDR
jgi:hypothetical protein